MDTEVNRAEGLRHESVSASLGGTICHFWLGMGRKDENFDFGRRGILPHPAQHFPTIEARKADIEHHNMRIGLVDLMKAADAIYGT